MNIANKKVVLCISDKSELSRPLLKLKDSDLLKGKEIHLLNIFNQEVYAYEFSPYVWPDQALFEELKIPITKGLEKLASDMSIPTNNTTISCLLHHSPKQRIVEYLEEVKADMVIVVTRNRQGLKGFFSSSTAEHLLKFSPCDVYVIRAQEE